MRVSTPVDDSPLEEISQVLVLPEALHNFSLPSDFEEKVRCRVDEQHATPYAAAFDVIRDVCRRQGIIDDVFTDVLFGRWYGEDFCDLCVALLGKMSRDEVVVAPLDPLLSALRTLMAEAYLKSTLRLAYKLAFSERRLSLVCRAAEVTAEQLKVAAKVADNMSRLASMDTLTGLSNQGAFLKAVEIIKLRKDYCAVVFIDVDDFKKCNDVFSHEFGNKVLQTIASHLTSISRSGEGLELYRYGGDEFAVIIYGCPSRQNALQIAWRIASTLVEKVSGHKFQGEAEAHKQTVSVGVATGEESGIDNVCIRADNAMYSAKISGGKNCARVDGGSLGIGEDEISEDADEAK